MSENSDTRGISKEILQELLGELNEDFINDLPDKPEEILKFAKRRTHPFISEGIAPDLAQKMLDSRLSDKDYLLTLFKSMVFTFGNNQQKYEHPVASILVSQTGAGKSNLRTMLDPKKNRYIVVNSDMYKKFRLDAEQIRSADPTHFGALTGIDSYDQANNINEFAMAKGYNILVEVAPSLSQGLIFVDMDDLMQHGYTPNVHVMAVGDLVSALSIHYRYEEEKVLSHGKGDTKLTDLKRHDESYQAVEKVIKPFNPEMISLYIRGRDAFSDPVHIETEGSNMNGILGTLRRERQKSNFGYVTGDGIEKSSFYDDYQFIRGLMTDRNAPPEERQQLGKIFGRYLSCVREIREQGQEER